MQNPTPALVHLLVTLSGVGHGQCRVHVHVMAGQIQANQRLEENRPSRPGGTQEDQQTSRRASICDHVEHRPKPGCLLEITSCIAV